MFFQSYLSSILNFNSQKYNMRSRNQQALSIVYIPFLKLSAWRWLQTDEPKHVAERYDWKYILIIA